MNVAFIPVRGGSKSIPLKNIKKIAGKPLVYWCVSAANNASHVDLVVVATDSKQIKEYVAGLNLPKVYVYDRLPENATDTASTESVMLEFLQAKHNDICLKQEDNVILIQATSPVITADLLDDMMNNFTKFVKTSAL